MARNLVIDFDAVICLVEGFEELESLNLYYVVNDWFFFNPRLGTHV